MQNLHIQEDNCSFIRLLASYWYPVVIMCNPHDVYLHLDFIHVTAVKTNVNGSRLYESRSGNERLSKYLDIQWIFLSVILWISVKIRI